MSEVAISGVRARDQRVSLLHGLTRAISEYLQLVLQAQRTWLYGTALGVGAAWLNIVPGIAVPGWCVATILLGTLSAAQFQAFYCVRRERDLARQVRAVDAIINEIAQMRKRIADLRNRPVRDLTSYRAWKAELMEARGEAYNAIARLSPAEAETYQTIGTLAHTASGGIHDEHNMLLAVAARDLDHLADLIHGYTRFRD